MIFTFDGQLPGVSQQMAEAALHLVMARMVPEWYAWRIILVTTRTVTPMYKPFRPFGRGTALLGGLIDHIWSYINHFLTGMILQVELTRVRGLRAPTGLNICDRYIYIYK